MTNNAFVLATDGLFYSNPRVTGDDWYLQFDPHEPPCLVIFAADGQKVSTTEAVRLAEELLAKIGVESRVAAGPLWADRKLTPDDEPALSALFYLEVLAPLERRLLPRNARGRIQPFGESIVYYFGEDWG